MLPETLNLQLRANEVKTGVYQSRDRRVCIVVKVKEGKVYMLTWHDCTVQLEVSFREKFLVDYPLYLLNYPAMRAVRRFANAARGEFVCTPEARKVINSILVR